MNEALRKAVEPKRYTMQHRPDWAYNQCSMMPDKDGEYIRHSDVADALATHRANYDALVIRLGEVTALAESRLGLLRDNRDWFEAQAKVISKGCGSSWDLAQVREQRDIIDTHLKAADHV